MPAVPSTPSPLDIFPDQFSPWPKSHTGSPLRDYTRRGACPHPARIVPPNLTWAQESPMSSDEEEEDSCVQSYNYPHPNMYVLDVVILDVVEPCENLPDFEIPESPDFGSLLHPNMRIAGVMPVVLCGVARSFRNTCCRFFFLL